jgi:hypothetical protein
MRSSLLAVFGVLSGLVLIIAAQLGAFQTDDTRVIPLNTTYATFTQEALKPTDGIVNSDDLDQVLGALREMPQQIAFCAGKDISAAVKNSAAAFSRPEDQSEVLRDGTNEPLWVAAYLGTDGSMPPAYQIRSIELTGKTLRVAYERDESPGRSCDLRAYLIWAPVGPIEAGVYTLELFDVANQQVTLSRTYSVTTK